MHICNTAQKQSGGKASWPLLSLQRMQPLSNVGHCKNLARTLKLNNRFPRQKAEKKTVAVERLMTVKQKMI